MAQSLLNSLFISSVGAKGESPLRGELRVPPKKHPESGRVGKQPMGLKISQSPFRFGSLNPLGVIMGTIYSSCWKKTASSSPVHTSLGSP